MFHFYHSTMNHPSIPSVSMQLHVSVYSSFRSSTILSGMPCRRRSSQSDSLSTESKADFRSTYAIHSGLLNSRRVCNSVLSVTILSTVNLCGVKPLCYPHQEHCHPLTLSQWCTTACEVLLNDSKILLLETSLTQTLKKNGQAEKTQVFLMNQILPKQYINGYHLMTLHAYLLIVLMYNRVYNYSTSFS